MTTMVAGLRVARIEDRGRRDSYKINITADSVTMVHGAGGAIKQTKQELVARRGPPFGFGSSLSEHVCRGSNTGIRITATISLQTS